MHRTYNCSQLCNPYVINNLKLIALNSVRIIMISCNNLSSIHCCKMNTNIYTLLNHIQLTHIKRESYNCKNSLRYDAKHRHCLYAIFDNSMGIHLACVERTWISRSKVAPWTLTELSVTTHIRAIMETTRRVCKYFCGTFAIWLIWNAVRDFTLHQTYRKTWLVWFGAQMEIRHIASLISNRSI